ncbi:hypothetical protein Trisim1_005536 [Trichoderma cf. simile WF8]
MTATLLLDNTYKTNRQNKSINHWMSSFTLHMAIEQPSHLSHLLHRNPQDATPGMDALADLEPYPLANLMVGVTANPNRMPAALEKETIKNPNFTAAVRQLRDKKDARFKADSNGARALRQSRLVFVISSTVVSQKTCAQAFRISWILQMEQVHNSSTTHGPSLFTD